MTKSNESLTVYNMKDTLFVLKGLPSSETGWGKLSRDGIFKEISLLPKFILKNTLNVRGTIANSLTKPVLVAFTFFLLLIDENIFSSQSQRGK